MKKPSDQNADNTPILQEGIATILDNTDAGVLTLAKSHWYFGEWEELTKLDIESLSQNQDIAILAAMKATGYQQLNDMENSHKYIKIAKQLGCSQEIIARLLIAGVHNSLGRIAALQNNDAETNKHFEAAVELGGKTQHAKLARHARSVRELTRMGLLPQAAKLLEEENEVAKSHRTSPKENEARLKILASEIELINHELSLAHQKQQLYSTENRKESIVEEGGKVNIDALKKLSPSQLGQDLWVLERTNYKCNGYFVEFGATDGVLLSNTYLLEKEFGWSGICAEPNPDFFEKLKKNRTCIVSDACITDKTGDKVEFILANEYGGIDGVSTQGRHKDKVSPYKETGKTLYLETVSLQDFLLENNAPRKIDYLSIDTEGSEYLILSSFPFDEWRIDNITVEHNYEEQRDKIKSLLGRLGYHCLERQWDDWFYK